MLQFPPYSQSFEGAELQCYYCDYNEDQCNEMEKGTEVKCQLENPDDDHYGNACAVGYGGRP